MALLVGLNAATAHHTVGVDMPWRRSVLLGLAIAPVTVLLATLPLALR